MDGIIAQIERYCDKFNYSKMTNTLFNDAIDSMIRRTGKYMGNDFTVVCNHIGYRQIMEAIENKLRAVAIDGAYYYTKEREMVNVGATYRQYEYNGNKIVFTIDTALSEVYDKYGFILFVDTSIIEGKPNISMFTLKGRELLQGTIRGMASLNGSSSMGDISTAIDGQEIHLLGYSGVAYMNPYSGFIMQENVY